MKGVFDAILENDLVALIRLIEQGADVNQKLRANIKVVLVGDVSAGKPALAYRLRNNSDWDNRSEKRTIGGTFFTMFLENEGCYKLELWDAPGSPNFYSLIPMYCRDAQFFIVAFSLSEKETAANIQNRVNLIRAHNQAPIMLVGTKLETQYREISTEEGKLLAKSIDAISYIEFSAKDGRGRAEILEKIYQNLEARFPSVKTKGGIDSSPLLLAADKGCPKIIETLLKAGASVNQDTNDGATPLYIAAEMGHVDAIKTLLAGGAAINQANKDGETPLYVAAVAKKIVVCLILILRGAQWGKKGKPSNLSIEIQKAIEEAEAAKKTAFKTLLSQIQNFEIIEIDIAGDWLTVQELQQLILAVKKNTHIKTCLLGEQLAKASREDQSYLKGRFNDFEEAIQAALKQDEEKLLMLTGIKQAITTVMGCTALHIAALAGASSLIKPLSDRGISLEQKDKQGKTALQLAKECNHQNFVKELLSFQEAFSLKRLQEEAIQVKREAITFVERQKELSKDIEELLQLEESDIIKSYTKLSADYWITLRKLYSSGINVDSFQFPSCLVRHQEFSMMERAWIKLKGSPLTHEHPMFSKIYDAIEKLKGYLSKPSQKSFVIELIRIYQDYIDIVCNSPELEREILYKSPTLLLGFTQFAQVLKKQAEEVLISLKKQEGQHGGHVVHQIGNIHFKLNPHAPGVEYMVSSLGNMIAGQGATPTELLKVITPEGYPRIYLASKTVKGKELESLIKYHSELITKIRPDNFSAMVVLSLLTNPQDGKADNYMVEFKEDESIEILGIDNDIAFAEPMIKEYITTQEGKEVKCCFVNVKNVLYFFPQMRKAIDKEFRETFLKRVPEILLIEWLSLLHQKNQDYQTLLKQGVFSFNELSGSAKTGKGLQLPIKLAPGAVKILYQKLLKLRELLSGNPNITLQEVFLYIQPQLAKHYESVQARYPDDILRCVKVLYEESIEDAKELEAFKKATPEEQSSLMTESVIKTTTKLGFESERIEPIEKSIIEFLKVIDYSQLTQEMAPIFYEVLERFSFIYQDSSLLHLAVEEKIYNLASYLLKYQLVEVDAKDKEGNSALYQAVVKNNFLLVSLLVEEGAKLEGKEREYQGKPLLHWAVQQKSEGLIDVLLNNQLLPVDITNGQGHTALHIAGSMGELKIVQTLTTHGADIHKQDNLDRDVIDKITSRLKEENNPQRKEALQQTLEWLIEEKAKNMEEQQPSQINLQNLMASPTIVNTMRRI